MFHLVANALHGRLLFRTHAEARALFQILAHAFPDVAAMCVLPDHVHLVVEGAEDGRLARAMSAYARWRNHARGEVGAVWATQAPPEAIPDAAHRRRLVRYVHFAPCRAGLVADPLAWPWSTHRDSTGLAAPPVVAPAGDPAGFHRFVSTDPSLAIEGTLLPTGPRGPVSWEQVCDAVSAVCRVPAEALGRIGAPRTLALRTAWALDLRDTLALASATGMARSGVYRVCARVPGRRLLHREPALHACVRAVNDARFGPLPDGDLRGRPEWETFRARS
ncbi:MAG: hypothetical protein Q8P41_07300 [Pseudomonadota bacterium]|nr:hypothetical protein [Pseudomonadota bacterium]